MTSTLDNLKSTASSLPIPERAELAHFLLQSIDDEDEGAVAEWQALAEKRMEEVRAGRVVGIPAEEVLESMRRPRS